MGCSWGFWGALGALPSGMLQPPRHVTAAPACYRTLFSYLFFQAGLLHAALGSLLRLSSSLSSLSCLLDSPSGRFFPILHRIYVNKSNLNKNTHHIIPAFSMGKSTEPTFTGRNGAGRLLPSCLKRRSLGPAAVAQPSDTSTNMYMHIYIYI